MAITASPDKLAKAIRQCSILIRASTVSTYEWKKVIGRLVWIAIINRPLLAYMKRVFSSGSENKSHVIQVKDVWKRELRTLFPLLSLAAVNINMPISTLVIAFDASLLAGAVTKTFVDNAFAHALWTAAQSTRCSSTLPQNHEMPIVKLLANGYPWTKLLSHQWIKEEHINGLEAASTVLALEAAIRAGVCGSTGSGCAP